MTRPSRTGKRPSSSIRASLSPPITWPSTYLEKGDKAKALENCQKYLLIRGRSITAEELKEINALIQKIKG